MRDLIVQLLRHARGVWRYRWWMLGVAWVVCIIGWTVVARMPDQFEASARVYVDTQSVLSPFLRGLAIDTGRSDRKIQLMTRTLLSQPNLEKVMRMTDLDLKAKTQEDKERLIDELKSKLKFRGTSRENLYTISYTDHSPELAKLVVKSLLTIFMESNLGESRKDQDSATAFLEQEVAEYERRMREAEEKLAAFKQHNLGYLPEESGGYYETLAAAKKRVAQAELELRLAEDKMNVLQRQLGGESPTFGLGPAIQSFQVDTSDYDSRINAIESRLDDMLLKYTDKHPDVIAMREKLAILKKEKAAFVRKTRRAVESGGVVTNDVNQNPVFQQMKIGLANAESEAAAKRLLRDKYKADVEKLEQDINRVLKVENEQKELNRDYNLLKKNHAVLLSRLESARLGRKADNQGDSVKFKVIDPPRAPVTPSGPNRILYSSVVLLLGLAVGFGVAFLMSQLRPTFDERQMMSDALGLPVLGSVNMVWTRDQIHARKVRNVSFAFTFTGLVVSFGIVLALYQLNIDILPRLANSLHLS